VSLLVLEGRIWNGPGGFYSQITREHGKLKACDHLRACYRSDLGSAHQDLGVVDREMLRLGMQIVLQWGKASFSFVLVSLFLIDN